ncbi:hypothetical protein GNE08_26395 [Trichormus variabilis ARAD]|uniref:Uncharacterized protein n=1 Tax=Trichormus variabilis N2B TaxID=2681315 RepID=A0ABR6S8F6_ANAVA|nr:hypothetical protein [Trichormus variabilis]MBC1217729.1 hypothetical protein [Trichormus variabilis ARAD]MBC1258980.1 hypothetical protein [Trichormus variabilis V5]MBC1302691.1 hypothetical protein [Trichormus variabilis N2B]MBC1324546.1 hypothetical protein [Trichormus variabilis 9RC]MBC1324604.1 hypothetical protein [Trichormus variabilis 9RC]
MKSHLPSALKSWLNKHEASVKAQINLLQQNGVKPPYYIRVRIKGVHYEVDVTALVG